MQQDTILVCPSKVPRGNPLFALQMIRELSPLPETVCKRSQSLARQTMPAHVGNDLLQLLRNV